MKLDRLLAKHERMGRKKARDLISSGQVRTSDGTIYDHHLEIDRFTSVYIGHEPVQTAERALYLMLHKPIGVVSATVDREHQTVIDLIDDPDRSSLHLVGRLDRNTSGLMLLTNDGRWSKALMAPERKIAKIYHVRTLHPIRPDAVEAFANGFYFHTEDRTTMLAHLEIIGDDEARVTLHEGLYHQIKRMFHRVENQVIALHREQLGPFRLPDDLQPGQWIALDKTQAWSFQQTQTNLE
ncbi:pseudouridine synthase [Luteolibacter pohnpeiensis]|uniref:Pseudouridine synthase n=1 Tax=Luteolibacter pohnpeiensis TaxID=454153 RepID=A0A934VWH2_9BACT|nr:pseudouridine synthase [Luteolibacter pohnpeiensis]MBK1883280.1 pseudouridine synthase [Luteolibacter pohnpeiensis]